MQAAKSFTLAGLLILMVGVALSAQAQTTRQMTTRTAFYSYRANPLSAGRLIGVPNAYYVTYSGQAQSFDSKLAVSLKVFTITLQYTVNDGVGTLLGGQWTTTVINKDRPPQTLGGGIDGGVPLPVRADNTIGPGSFALTLTPGDPDWPIFGTVIGEFDKSNPAKVSSTLSLTYPVVL